MKLDRAMVLGLAGLLTVGMMTSESFAVYGEADHSGDAVGGDPSNPQSSVQIHKHREGVILPLGPNVSAMPMSSINVEAEATFFSCLVRNFIINVRAEFVLGPPANDTSYPFAVAFPITTHALYGDHNQFRDITVSVDNAEIGYRVALDRRLWSIQNGELWYKGRLVNSQVHPLLTEAKDLNLVAPHLVARGYDLVIYWHMPPTTSTSTSVVVEYTSNSDDFCYCCHEVRACTYGSDPYYFYFDLSNANYWRGPRATQVVLSDSSSAIWSGVPSTNMATTFTQTSIVLTSDPASNAALEDIAVPAQPAVFGANPRRWPQPPPSIQDFALGWLGGINSQIDHAVVDRIEPTDGILVEADLPIRLDEQHPTDEFSAAFVPPAPDLAYIDVFGRGHNAQGPHGLYDAWLRLALNGKTIMGHDLAVTDLSVGPNPDGSTAWAVTVGVENQGVFTEPLLVTLLVDYLFVRTQGYPSLDPGESVTVTIPIDWAWTPPAVVEVEVEPAPGEVDRVDNAAEIEHPAPPLPRHANFVLRPGESTVRFHLSSGAVVESKLFGAIQLFLGDPDVPVIGLPGMVGLSVDGATLVAPHFHPPIDSTTDHIPPRLLMFQAPWVTSTGSWNYITGEIQFEMYLVKPNGDTPAQQPTLCHGRLTNAGLSITGLSSEPTAVPKMILDIFADEAPWQDPNVWFSTENGFHAGNLDPDPDDPSVFRYISDGDLLSRRGYVVRTNHELTRNLGIMPVVPDLGLDATVLGPRRQIWFSFEEEFGQIWSETLGVWLKHGDLLSSRGYVVATNQRLIHRFGPMPVVHDVGLDAVVRGPCRHLLFSIETDFFSETLGVTVRHGDLLSTRGRIVLTNAQLLRNFNPLGPVQQDYGLDAIALRSNGEIWFSIEDGFLDQNLGPISDGDLLSTAGYVVAGNLDLVAAFGPLEDVDNFGLDGLSILRPAISADFDRDGDVDGDDAARVLACMSGTDVAQADPACWDVLIDDDNDVDADDLAIVESCVTGPDIPADASCCVDLTAVAWRSMKYHGMQVSQPLPIALDPLADNDPTSEPRGNRYNWIEVDFTEPVVLVDPGAVSVTSGQAVFVPDGVEMLDDDTLAIVFLPDALPDQTIYTIDVAGVVTALDGRALVGDTDCRLRVLVGDVSGGEGGDGVVNLIDAAEVKGYNSDHPTTPELARFDINGDGVINLIDYAEVKQRNGNSVSAP